MSASSHFVLRGVHRFAVIAATLACSVYAGAAVTRIYEWREADGTLALSNRPPPATASRYTTRDVEVPAARPAVSRDPACREAGPAASAAAASAAAGDDRAVEAAQDALARARREHDAGTEPLPGERRANAGGGSRLLPEYFARQERLEQSVLQAEGDVLAAMRRRGAEAERTAAC